MTDWRALAAELEAPMVDFCRRLIQTPSLPGEEGPLAALVRAEMGRLGYDEVTTDGWGNVIGVLTGTGGGRSVMLNTHLDHVSPGDPALWPIPPYEGRIVDGVLYGRAASDIKGATAPQVYAAALLRRAGVRPAGDLYVTVVVREETGGLGARELVTHLRPGCAVLGEGSDNELRHGHRGRMEVVVEVRGRSVHASVPTRGANPHYVMARLLGRLEGLAMATDPLLGASSVAPTLYRTDQTSSNVTPGICWLHLDWRNVPAEPPEAVRTKVQALLEEVLADGMTGAVSILTERLRTYTGQEAEVMMGARPFVLPVDHPVLTTAARTLAGVLGRPIPIKPWGFATDGGHFMHAGIPTIGFSPCEEQYAHTIHDQISLAKMVEALAGYAALVPALSGVE